MTPSPLRTAIRAALGVAAGAALLAICPPAGGQSRACPDSGLRFARVRIDQPVAGRVTPPVLVRGVAEAPFGLSRVEVFAGGQMVASSDLEQARTVLPFDLRWDAKNRTGPVILRVRVCGSGAGATLLSGESSVSVEVQPPPPTAAPAPGRPLVITEASDDEEGPDRPLWVGAVVGLSGLAGLAFSAILRRRRSPVDDASDDAVRPHVR